MKIINMTGKPATPEQLEAGVIEPTEAEQAEIRRLLSFDSLPYAEDLRDRALVLSNIAKQYEECHYAMIDGPTFFIPDFEYAVFEVWKIPVYPFYIRTTLNEDVSKDKFTHLGFVSQENKKYHT